MKGKDKGTIMTQKGYENLDAARRRIANAIDDTTLTPEEGYDALRAIGFGKSRAIEIVDEAGKGKFRPCAEWMKESVGR